MINYSFFMCMNMKIVPLQDRAPHTPASSDRRSAPCAVTTGPAPGAREDRALRTPRSIQASDPRNARSGRCRSKAQSLSRTHQAGSRRSIPLVHPLTGWPRTDAAVCPEPAKGANDPKFSAQPGQSTECTGSARQSGGCVIPWSFRRSVRRSSSAGFWADGARPVPSA